jgi:hypothetical protein
MPDDLSAAPHPSPDALTYSPRELLVRVLRRWWLVALVAILGGGIGLGADALRPQPYEAGFSVVANIDMTTAGELTQYQEDITYEALGALLFAPSLQQVVEQQADQEGLGLPAGYLGSHATVERRLATWEVRVRHSDPQTAERLASIWQEAARAEIERAYDQAVLADGLERYLESVEGCLARAALTPPSYGLCSQANLTALQGEVQQTGAALSQARLDSRGLSSSLSLGRPEMDVTPARAVFNQRALLTLSGCLIGLLAGLWLAQVEFHGKRSIT